MGKRFNLIEAAMKRKQICFAITAVLIVFGVYALIFMPRQEFPEFTIRQGVIIGVMPGASSEQVENELTKPMENYLFSYQEINKGLTYSHSKDGMMIIYVEVNEEVAEPKMFWNKLKHGISDLKRSLPPEVLGIWTNDDFGNTSAILVSFESDSKSYRELESWAKQFEDRVRALKSVSRISRIGMQNEEIKVCLKNEKLSYYNIKPLVVLSMLKSEGGVSYGGSIDDGNSVLPVHFSSKYRTLEDLSEQIVYSDPAGNVIRLKDIATITRGMKEPDSYITNNGRKCILVSLEMLNGYNIVMFGEDVRTILDEIREKLPPDISIGTIANQPDVVDTAVMHFLREFGIAILAVIFVTFLLLPIRVSTIAGLTIPITILVSLGILYLIGIQFHTVSLASLILVLGIVVDDSVVIIDNYVEKLDEGLSPWEAAKRSATELFLPVFTATFAILGAFLPLYIFMTGAGRDFIYSLPVTIATALITSLLVAYFLVPYICYKTIRKGLKRDVKKRRSVLDLMQAAYDKTIELVFKIPKMTIIFAAAITVVGVFLGVNIKRELFPKMERNQFAVEIYLPVGASLARTEAVVKDCEARIMKDKRVTSVTSFIGTSSPRFHTLYAPNMPAKNYAQMIVNTTSDRATVEMLDEYNEKLKNLYPGVYIKLKQLDMQFSKYPIEIRLSGDSINLLRSVGEEVAAIFRQNKNVLWVKNDYENQSQSLNYEINRYEANRLGFTQSMIGTYMAISGKGFPVTTLWEGEYPVDVVVTKEQTSDKPDFEFNSLYMSPLFTPGIVPFRQVASLKPEWNEGVVVRRNGVRTLTVGVEVVRGVYPSDVFNAEKEKVETLKLPAGVKLEFGGEKEFENMYYKMFGKSIALGILLILFILLFQFRTMKSVVLIMITIPLSLFGAAVGLIIMGYPFGFTSFVGLMSLSGVVVRNGIILVDYAGQLRREQGMSVREAAMAAGKRRLRPIFLTSAAAAIGVLPMLIFRSLLWAPVATVLCFGLLFSMVLTLYSLPILYWYFFKSEDNQSNMNNPVVSHE